MGKFDELSDLDLEELVADLFTAEFGRDFRAGARGRDKGVDVDALASRNSRHIVQVKHYLDSTFPQLKAAAKKEAKKLEDAKHRIASYRFVTSRRGTILQKQQLAKALSPWIKSTDDVYVAGDLEQLLRRHPEVEARHVKLWLKTAAQLRQELSAAAYKRSEALVAETRSALPRYVETASLREARQILLREGVCVVAGPPGVGKTTLARLLLVAALHDGMQPFEITHGDIQGAWPLLQLKEPQIFFFDDFLGRTFLTSKRDDDEQLLRFMRQVSKLPNRQFVLTTREYILKDAMRASEIFERESQERQKYLLTLESYSRRERARILYNHVFHSPEVDETARRSLVEDRIYLKIIDHKNFNPRLIEWMCGLVGGGLSDDQREEFGDHCIAVLNDPERIWHHAYEDGISEQDRVLLMCFVGLEDRVSVTGLRVLFRDACKARGLKSNGTDFERSLRVLEGSFLSIGLADDEPVASPINPSLDDFLAKRFFSDLDELEAGIGTCVSFEQTLWFWEELSRRDAGALDLLASHLADAVERTIGLQSEIRWKRPLSRTYVSLPPEFLRLTEVADRCRRQPALRSALADWLSLRATEYSEWIIQQPSFLTEHLRGLQTIQKAGGFPAQGWARPLVEMALKGAWTPDRAEIIDTLRHLDETAVSDGEYESEHAELEGYIQAAMKSPEDFFDHEHELEGLSIVAEEFGLAIDDERYFAAQEAIEAKEEDESGWEPDSDDWRDLSSDSDSDDADIVSMFDRFGS